MPRSGHEPHRTLERPRHPWLLLILAGLLAAVSFLAPSRLSLGPSRVAKALHFIPLKADTVVLVDLANNPLSDQQLSQLATFLEAPPPRDRPDILIHYRQDVRRVTHWAFPEKSPRGPTLADTAATEKARQSDGAYLRFPLQQDRLEAILSREGELLVGSWRADGPSLPAGNLTLASLDLFPMDTANLAVADLHAWMRNQAALLQWVEEQMKPWELSLQKDVLPLLQGEVAFQLDRPDLRPGPESRVLLGLVLADPSSTAALIDRLLPAVVSSALPSFYREGVTIRRGRDGAFTFTLVSDFLLVGLNLDVEDLERAVGNRVAGRSLAQTSLGKAVSSSLASGSASLAVMQTVAGFRVMATGEPQEAGIGGTVVIELQGSDPFEGKTR